MPTHNRSSLVTRAVKSILQQSYTNIEIIVVDDGSTDDTFEMLKPFIDSGEIVYLKNDVANGAPFSRNRAINIAKGSLITGLDDDDFFLPNRIEVMVDAFDSKVSFVSTGYEIHGFDRISKVYVAARLIELEDALLSNIVGNQVLTRTEYMRSLNGFDESLPAWQDYDMWIRLLRKYGAGKRIDSSSYVVDKSHEHERISGNTNKIIAAFNVFINKHSEYSERRNYVALKASLIQYDISNLKAVDVIDVFCGGAFKRAAGLIWMRFKN